LYTFVANNKYDTFVYKCMNQEEKESIIAKLEEIRDYTHPNQDELRNKIQIVIWDIQELDHIPEVHPEPILDSKNLDL